MTFFGTACPKEDFLGLWMHQLFTNWQGLAFSSSAFWAEESLIELQGLARCIGIG